MLLAIAADINHIRKQKTMKLEQTPPSETGGPVENAFHDWYKVERPIGWLPKEYTAAKLAFFNGFANCASFARVISRPGLEGQSSQIQADVAREVGWFLAGMPALPPADAHN